MIDILPKELSNLRDKKKKKSTGEIKITINNNTVNTNNNSNSASNISHLINPIPYTESTTRYRHYNNRNKNNNNGSSKKTINILNTNNNKTTTKKQKDINNNGNNINKNNIEESSYHDIKIKNIIQDDQELLQFEEDEETIESSLSLNCTQEDLIQQSNKMDIDIIDDSKNNIKNSDKIINNDQQQHGQFIDQIVLMDIDTNWYSGDPLVSEVLKDEKETMGMIEKKKLELQSIERTISTLREARESVLKDIMIKKQFLKCVQRKKEDQIKTITNSYQSIATKYNLSQVESRSLTLILPEEVMLHIFKFLSPLDLCRGVCRVSQKWRSLSFDISLWRDICLQRRLLDGSNYYLPPSESQLTYSSYSSSISGSLNSSTGSCNNTFLSSSTGSMNSNVSSSSSSTNTSTTSSSRPYGDNWYVGEFRKDSNWRRGKYSTTIIRGHREIVWSLLFESETNTLISGSEDMTVKVWDCNGMGSQNNNSSITGSGSGLSNVPMIIDDLEDSNKRCIKTLTGHKNGTICLGSTPTRLVSGSADGSLKIWDRQEGTCIETIQTHSSVWCLQIMGDQLICGCVDGTMRVFDLNTSNCLRTLRGHTAPVRCLQAVNHNGQDLIISGSYDKTIKIWDVDSRCVNTIRAHTHKINCIQFENGQLVSGSHDSLLKIWDMNGGLIHTLQGHDNMIHCLQFKGNKLLSGSTDSTIRLWDLKTGSHVNTIKGQSAVCCLKFNDSKLITGYEDSTIKIFDFSF